MLRAVPWLGAVLACWLLGAGCSCDRVCLDSYEARSGALHVVELPGRWSVAGAPAYPPSAYDLRRDASGLLLLRARWQDGEVSGNVLRFAEDGRSSGMTGPEAWDSARPLAAESTPVKLAERQPSASPVRFEGKPFPRRGGWLGAAVADPSRRWLAVVTFTGEVGGRSLLPPIGGLDAFGHQDAPTKGEFFLEIFDVTSGRAVQTAGGRYGGYTPSALGLVAVWSDSRRFLLLLPGVSRGCLLSTLPAPEQRSR